MMKHNPKMAVMMQDYSKVADKSIYAYLGELTLFDDQEDYDKVLCDLMEWFKLSAANGNGVPVFERDDDNK